MSLSEHEQLNQILSGEQPSIISRDGALARLSPSSVQPTPNGQITKTDLAQWQVGANGIFRPSAKTIEKLPPAVYVAEYDQLGLYFERKPVLCDEIVDLPDSSSARVLDSMRRFWESKDKYSAHGLIYKRGIILWGPPGSGKTVTIHILMRNLILLNGIVLISRNPEVTAEALQIIRKIEPELPLIVVMEDIDETIHTHGEHGVLMMLDGETQIDNVVYLATTNYPERLGARIINRPSRFDERVLVGMPSRSARLRYLQVATANGESGLISAETLNVWANDTDGLSIAHLRELVAAVACLGQDYEEVLVRLRSMCDRPKDHDGFRAKKLGLLAS